MDLKKLPLSTALGVASRTFPFSVFGMVYQRPARRCVRRLDEHQASRIRWLIQVSDKPMAVSAWSSSLAGTTATSSKAARVSCSAPRSVRCRARQPGGSDDPCAGHRLPCHRRESDQERRFHSKQCAYRAVTLIQRFGSAHNLNLHFHMLLLGGVHVERGDGRIRFRWVKAPLSADLTHLAETIARPPRCRARASISPGSMACLLQTAPGGPR